jgi:hypothetical protein
MPEGKFFNVMARYQKNGQTFVGVFRILVDDVSISNEKLLACLREYSFPSPLLKGAEFLEVCHYKEAK